MVEEATDILVDAEQHTIIVLDEVLPVEPSPFFLRHVGAHSTLAEVRHVGAPHVG